MTDLIAELKALKEKATPGPWYQSGDPWFTSNTVILAHSPDPHAACPIGDTDVFGDRRDEHTGYCSRKHFDPGDDAALIVALVNHLPTILARLEEGERMREAQSDRRDLVAEIDALRLTAARTVGLENYNRACRERDEARAESKAADAALSPLDDVVHHLGIEDSFTTPVEAIKKIEQRALSAEAALAQARADALEEAAKWHDQRRRDTPDAFEMEFHEVSAKAIRALKATPTQESETP